MAKLTVEMTEHEYLMLQAAISDSIEVSTISRDGLKELSNRIRMAWHLPTDKSFAEGELQFLMHLVGDWIVKQETSGGGGTARSERIVRARQLLERLQSQPIGGVRVDMEKLKVPHVCLPDCPCKY